MGKESDKNGWNKNGDGGGILNLKNVLGKDKLPNISRETIEAKIEAMVDEYVDPFFEKMGQHYYSVSFGLFLGAAVATGVCLGGYIICNTMILSIPPPPPLLRNDTGSSSSTVVPLKYGSQFHNLPSPIQSLIRTYVKVSKRWQKAFSSFIQHHNTKVSNIDKNDGNSSLSAKEGEEEEEDNQGGHKENKKKQTTLSSSSSYHDNNNERMFTCNASYLTHDEYTGEGLLLLKSSTGSSGEEDTNHRRKEKQQQSSADENQQCSVCLKRLSDLLMKHNARWKDIRKLSIYVVDDDKCDVVSGVQHTLQEYPMSDENTMISYIFVPRLQHRDAIIEVEALVNIWG